MNGSASGASTCRRQGGSDSHFIRREAAGCCLLKCVLSNSKGVTDVLCEACDQLGWTKPTKIQIEAIPLALQGRLKLNIWPGTDLVWSSTQIFTTRENFCLHTSSEIKIWSLKTKVGGLSAFQKVLGFYRVYFL